MKKLIALSLICLLPLPALALRVDNCDDEPHTVQVYYSGDTLLEVELPAGMGRYIPGIPIAVQAGNDYHDAIFYDDEYCVWGPNDIQIQKRRKQQRGGG